MKVECVTLEDGLNYIIMDKKIINNIEYLYLTNENDFSDFVIRKINNDEIIGLNDEEEYKLAFSNFIEKA